MRIRLLLSLLLLPVFAQAQELFTVKGRIVDEQGEPVEYVHIGIPKREIGTISTVDGRFEIEVPADTLEFHHVSYLIGLYPVSGSKDNVVIVLHDNELPPAVAIGGDTKEKYLVRAGTIIAGGLGDYYRPSTASIGQELGSIAKAGKPFLIKEIRFSVTYNYIPGCVASINIYRIEGKPESFENILHKPIYVNVAMSETQQNFCIKPDEFILLEPGKYFIAFQIVSTDEEAVRKYEETPEAERERYAMHLYTPLYFKSSYIRHEALGKMEHLPVNIGITVKGLEYQ